ncbi:unnamed protein product [Effrenium voratum]|uniref:Uncharacterized protein n=1 Tax=Effrenium voratum TaxID=2562239 RepID=A0AA36HS50_9DINO|nr:unnamed protein product [Effrenium voratum]CAJ1434406.1 unnamed protein product [Effrenium voratum]
MAESRSRSPRRHPERRVRCLALSGEVLAEVELEPPAAVADLRAAVRESTDIDVGQSLRFLVGASELKDEDKVPSEVTALISSKDWVITGCSDGSAATWDATTGEYCQSLFGHDLSIISVALSPDSSSIATASSDCTVRLWSVRRQAWRLTLRGHRSCVLCVNFSGDGNFLVSASSDKTARVWSAGSFGECISVLRGHRKDVSWAAFSPDDSCIVTGSDDRTVVLWDAATLARRYTLAHSRRINCVTFSGDGARLAIACRSTEVVVWKVYAMSEVQEEHHLRHPADVFAACWNPKVLHQLAAAAADGRVIIWDAAAGVRVACLEGHRGKVLGLNFSPGGQLLATASADRTAKLWSCDTFRRPARIAGCGALRPASLTVRFFFGCCCFFWVGGGERCASFLP